MREAPVSFDAKSLLIIPPKHHVAKLLIGSFHQKPVHAGQKHILAHLRETFWIPSGMSALRKVVRSYKACKNRKINMEQMMAGLPVFRSTAYESCFTYSEIDYFGPLNV